MPDHAVSLCCPTGALVFRGIVFTFKRDVSQSIEQSDKDVILFAYLDIRFEVYSNLRIPKEDTSCAETTGSKAACSAIFSRSDTVRQTTLCG